jgi:hypothetical protein
MMPVVTGIYYMVVEWFVTGRGTGHHIGNETTAMAVW